MFRKALCLSVAITFLCLIFPPVGQVHAQLALRASTAAALPEPGAMVNLSPAYQPAVIKGLTVHKDNPFRFDFIVDIGQDKLAGEPLKKEGEKLIKYFLAALTIPEDDLWVNLSPYEKDRTIPEALSQTDMGRDLLAQDYILKQITASLIYPEKEFGRNFWDRVYAQAGQAAVPPSGTAALPLINTFNKVWIMADKAEVLESNQTVFVVSSHLRVMLEEDYLALNKNNKSAAAPKGTTTAASQMVREIILPEIEREVNTGKNFATLRQIINSLVLANWYKKNLKEALLNQVYTSQNKVSGIDLEDKTVKAQIYERYLAAYKKGVFNLIKDEIHNGQNAPRKYFAGGFMQEHAFKNPLVSHDLKDAQAIEKSVNDLAQLAVNLDTTVAEVEPGDDAAMVRDLLSRGEVNLAVDLAMKSDAAKTFMLQVNNAFGQFSLPPGLTLRLHSTAKGFSLKATYDITDPDTMPPVHKVDLTWLRPVAGLIRKSNSRSVLTQLEDFLMSLRDPTPLAEENYLATMTVMSGSVRVQDFLDEFVRRPDYPTYSRAFAAKVLAQANSYRVPQLREFTKDRNYPASIQDALASPPRAPISSVPMMQQMLLKGLKDVVADRRDLRVVSSAQGGVHLTIASPGLRTQQTGKWLNAATQKRKLASMGLTARALSKAPKEPLDVYFELDNPRGTEGFNFLKFHLFLIQLFSQLQRENSESLRPQLQEILDAMVEKIIRVESILPHEGEPRNTDEFLAHHLSQFQEMLQEAPDFLLGKIQARLEDQITSLRSAEQSIIKTHTQKMLDIITSFHPTDAAMTGGKIYEEALRGFGKPPNAAAKGGIDLTARDAEIRVSKQGTGVQMSVDPALIERIKRDGIQRLRPVIFRITPITSIWSLLK